MCARRLCYSSLPTFDSSEGLHCGSNTSSSAQLDNWSRGVTIVSSISTSRELWKMVLGAAHFSLRWSSLVSKPVNSSTSMIPSCIYLNELEVAWATSVHMAIKPFDISSQQSYVSTCLLLQQLIQCLKRRQPADS